MSERSVLRRVAPAALAALVGGCALPPPSGCISAPEEAASLVFLPATVMGPAERRVRFADPWEFNEYALYRGGGARLEAVYLQTRFKHRTNVVLDFADPLVERTLGFAYNAGLEPRFEKAERIETAFGGLWIRAYRHPVTGQRCAGFIENWDERVDDPGLRPSKGVYGYYCAAGGATPDKAAADRVLAGLEAGTRPVDVGVGGPGCDNAGVRSTRSEGRDLAARAGPSGAAGSPAAAGDAEFPPVRALRFNDQMRGDDFES